MTEYGTIDRPGNHRLAYHVTPRDATSRAAPGVVFLGGFASDMTGTKALALEDYCQTRGLGYLRFDYLGHGKSSGSFTDGTIGRWTDDAVAALDALTQGPQILIGSSMGGWIMLRVALARPDRVAGLLGIAAAPDFTEDLIRRVLNEDMRARLNSDGVINLASDYDDAPYAVTRRLIEEARDHLLLDGPIALHCPVRLLQGMADRDVPWRRALTLADSLASDDVEITLIKRGDHRLSEPQDIKRLCSVLDGLIKVCGS